MSWQRTPMLPSPLAVRSSTTTTTNSSRQKAESLLEICTSSTTIGNTISVHMLEYLSAAKKTPPSGFQDVAVEFLETSRVLFATRAGLVGAVRLGLRLEDAASERLETRLQQAKSALVFLGQMMEKLLGDEKKEKEKKKKKTDQKEHRPPFGRLRVHIRKIFVEGDLEKARTAMAQSRNGLEAYPLPSNIGDARVVDVMAQVVGYQALAAALEQPDPTTGRQEATLPPPPPSPSGPLPLPPSGPQPSIRAQFDPSKAPNSVMPNGETPFTHAMNRTTPMSLIERMLQNGANVDQKNRHGETALFKAIACERHDVVARLLSAGADPNLPGPKMLLWPAVHRPRMLEALLAAGASLARAPGVLELATSINSPEAAEILLRHGVDVNAKKDGIYTPLCSAIRDDRRDLFEILLEANADPNLPGLDSPTFHAVSHHRTHFLPGLIAAGADLHTPAGLIECAVAHDNKDGLLFLLNHRLEMDINARNAAGHTALTTAIREGKLEFIDILLSHGADPAVRGQDWPISLSVKRPDILAKLLPHIHQTSAIANDVLEMAVAAHQLESVELLIEKRGGGGGLSLEG